MHVRIGRHLSSMPANDLQSPYRDRITNEEISRWSVQPHPWQHCHERKDGIIQSTRAMYARDSKAPNHHTLEPPTGWQAEAGSTRRAFTDNLKLGEKHGKMLQLLPEWDEWRLVALRCAKWCRRTRVKVSSLWQDNIVCGLENLGIVM